MVRTKTSPSWLLQIVCRVGAFGEHLLGNLYITVGIISQRLMLCGSHSGREGKGVTLIWMLVATSYLEVGLFSLSYKQSIPAE